MPASPKRSDRRSRTRSSKYYKPLRCLICRSSLHSLRLCRKFLDMNMSDRWEAVRRHKYCVNCLAQDHSHGRCFSDRGCHHCKKFHNTLLHVNPKFRDQILTTPRSKASHPSPSRSLSSDNTETPMRIAVPVRKKSIDSTSTVPITKQSPSLSAIMRQNRIILLPTVLVKVNGKNPARCLLDSGSPVSRISKKFVDKFNLITLTLKDETICPLTLQSRFNANLTIEGTFRVDNRINTITPAESLQESFRSHYPHLFLADPSFSKSGCIDIVIGVDIYPRVMSEGTLMRHGLPTAQNTVFGWVVYGSFSQ
ncbi:uncharacterized protein LOC142224743 [Haematobia irritans]|uniref:uncharacterized protein LOC142224743 n=1 Tax=Haematobia irritans TaxID=7368 RepID=UPI003F4F9B57